MGYSAEIYELAEGELEKRRLRSEQALEKRRSLLYARSPRAAELERRIAKTSVAAAKEVFGGADLHSRLEELKRENLSLQKELETILTGFGFPQNFLDPWYTCPQCRDRGDVDGKMCSCMRALLRQFSYDQLNKISPLSLSDFESFSLDYYSKAPAGDARQSPNAHMTAVLGFCKKYARTFSTASRSLLFQGPPGLGKTHLSLAVAKELIDRGFGVIYVSAPALLTKLAKETMSFDYREPSSNTEQLLSECDLLILDDLGTEFSSKFTVSAIYQLFNTRMILSKPTIISTNLTLHELQDKYNPRIISRIIGSLDRVEFVGTDIRQLKRRQKRQTANDQ